MSNANPHSSLQPLVAADLVGIWPTRSRESHKGLHGHIGLIGGNTGYGGAIILAAQATLRAGAGLATVFSRQDTLRALLMRQPECMGCVVEAAQDLSRREFDVRQRGADVLVLGPGLGRDAWATALTRRFLDDPRPRVVDADGLNLLAKAPRRLSNAVLTPHPGEAARLLDGEVADIQSDRISAVQRLTARYGSVVVLKGAGTLVSSPQGTIYRIDAGNPGMAVGGMGDLLSGVIAALLGQGFGLLDAARWGALLHSVAADEAAHQGQRGLVPSDLLPYLRAGCNR